METPAHHPKTTFGFIGNKPVVEATSRLLAAHHVPRSWILAGPRGVGKATFAYHLARYLLMRTAESGSAPSNNLFGEPSLQEDFLSVSEDLPSVRRMLAGSHADLLEISLDYNDDDKKTETLSVDEIRRIGEFLSTTPGEAACRVVIIDPADAMNQNAANALLKILEEPPSFAHIFLISHTPGSLLPTIRSRCQMVHFTPLAHAQAGEVLKGLLPRIAEPEREVLLQLAGGSPGLAYYLHGQDMLHIMEELHQFVDALPKVSPAALKELMGFVTGKQALAHWQCVVYGLQCLVRAKLQHTLHDSTQSRKWLALWDAVTRLGRDAVEANLDKAHAFATLRYQAQEIMS